MDRILIFGMTQTPGGVESFLLNYYRNIDRTKLQFDFLCNFHEEAAYEEELLKLGGHVYHITPRRENCRKYEKELDEFFRETKGVYRTIWVNVCSLANIDYLKYGKKYGIPRRIIHSHNSGNMDNFLRGLLHRRNRGKIAAYATDFWACSERAADWFYKESLHRKVRLIHNAIPVEKYAFSPQKREEIRKKLKWSHNYVIGNIGRLHFQKNQEFVLDIFSVLIRMAPVFRLVLVGGGEDEEKLRKKASDYGLEDYIFWAGIQKDIGGWLSAFDLFLFPSLFEGQSVVALEAQANGLMTLASEGVISEEVWMNENFDFMSLSCGAKEWADRIMELRKGPQDRIPYEKVKRNFRRCGYDIAVEAGKMEEELLK